MKNQVKIAREFYVTYKNSSLGPNRNKCTRCMKTEAEAKQMIRNIKMGDHSAYNFELWSLRYSKPLYTES